MHSKILSIMLMALVFVVSCAAARSPPTFTSFNSTDAPGRISTRSMSCKTTGYVKLCTSKFDGSNAVRDISYDFVNEHLRYDLPDWKKTNYYIFCEYGVCGAMSTLSGSQFIPKNYDHVAYIAASDFLKTEICNSNGFRKYPNAVDIYYNEYNFLFSWWTTDNTGITTCTQHPGPYNSNAN